MDYTIILFINRGFRVVFSLSCINQLCLLVSFLCFTASGHGLRIEKVDFNCVLFNICKMLLVEYLFYVICVGVCACV